MLTRYIFNKIVRSFILDQQLNERKLIVNYKILNNEEFKAKLKEKLVEESNEVLNASNKEELIHELADCYEVMEKIEQEYGISREEVLSFKEQKNKIKGNFNKKHYINYIELHKNHPMWEFYHNYCNKDENKYIIEEIASHVVDLCLFKDDLLYVQKRSPFAKSFASTWELAGGHLECEETFTECIKRELKEECNLDLDKNYGIVYNSFYQNKQNQKCSYTAFLITAKNWNNFKLEEKGATEYKFINKNEIEILNNNEFNNNLYNAAKIAFEVYSNLK